MIITYLLLSTNSRSDIIMYLYILCEQELEKLEYSIFKNAII